ncbi:MAG: Spermidine/putrescine-binding periplasmic protein [Legionellaceae bacterium]
MKNLTLIYSLLFISLLSFFSPTSALASENSVNIFNWSGYMPDAILRQFEQETGIKVNYSTYDNNETLYAKLKANPNSGYDLVVPSTYFIDRMRKQKMLHLIDKSKLTNFQNINPGLLNKKFDPHNNYSIPFLWSTTGIVINTKFWQKNSIKSWKDLWKNQYYDQLFILDDVREVFSMALIALGYSANDTKPQHIKAAFQQLKKLMPNIKIFNAEAGKAIYIDEDVTIGMGWNGDINLANKENSNLEFIYPEEGYVISLDSMGIPINAPHLENAYKFINFILRPDIAKKISIETGYATANGEALKLLPKALRENPITYPNNEILARGHFQTDAGSSSTLFEQYFQQLKIGG